jgi:hypothetical protein
MMIIYSSGQTIIRYHNTSDLDEFSQFGLTTALLQDGVPDGAQWQYWHDIINQALVVQWQDSVAVPR